MRANRFFMTGSNPLTALAQTALSVRSIPGVLVLIIWGATGPATVARGAAADVVPRPQLEMQEISPQAWFRQVRDKLSEKFGLDPEQLRFSPPPPKLAAFVRPPRPRARARRYEIVVVDVEGQTRGRFPAVTARGNEPPRNLRFLNDDRLLYEVVEGKRRPRPRQLSKRKAQNRAARPVLDATAAPKRLFVIQPVARRARPIRCAGLRFAFTGKFDRVAFVAGKPGAAFVAVNGVQVYPRRGRSIIPSELAWSKDGSALAFLETPPRKPARLVLLADYANPGEDVSWELPASTSVEGARVFWVRPNRLVVGKASGKPLFTASFDRHDASEADTFSP
jgi:hypothetical protein